jgi:hypothetical protein
LVIHVCVRRAPAETVGARHAVPLFYGAGEGEVAATGQHRQGYAEDYRKRGS